MSLTAGTAPARGARRRVRPARRAASARIDRRLTRESSAARAQFALAGLLGVATAAVIVAQAALLALIIARAATHRVALADVRTPLIALGGVLLLRALLAGAFELSGRLGAIRVISELRGRLARRLLLERPGRLAAERTGELAAAAVQGVDSLEAYFAGYLPSLVLAVAVPAAVLIWVAPLDPAAAVILFVTVPILIVFMILIGKGAQAQARSRWRALALLSSHFLDVVRGLETLRVHRRERAQEETLAQIGERYRRETMGTLRIAFLSALVLELCAMIGTALVAATIGVQLVGGRLSLQAGLTVLLLAPELYGPLRSVGQQFHASADGLAVAEQLFAALDGPGTLDVRSTPIAPPDPGRFGLTFDHVSFAYESRPAVVLRELDLELNPGELLALIGPSGAGKSTVASLALRLADPTTGAVRCGEVDLRDVDPRAWQRRIAWVPQRAKLFTGTVAENIALAEPEASRERIERAAANAGLGELIGLLERGLDTRVGEGGRRLSAGQAQRVALARAFLREAPLVILDEPTANLDADTSAAVGAAIAQLARGRTMLLISHDRSLARHADRIVELAP